ncbi:MAG: hypothetical protein ACK5LY_03495 [Lachnospirales bacterium]
MKLIHILYIILIVLLLALLGQTYYETKRFFNTDPSEEIYGNWTQNEYDEAIAFSTSYYKKMSLDKAIVNYEYLDYEDNYDYIPGGVSDENTIMLKTSFDDTLYTRYIILRRTTKNEWEYVIEGTY